MLLAWRHKAGGASSSGSTGSGVTIYRSVGLRKI